MIETTNELMIQDCVESTWYHAPYYIDSMILNDVDDAKKTKKHKIQCISR